MIPDSLHAEFATKRELEIVESKLDDLAHSNTALTVTMESIARENRHAIDSLTKAVSEINESLQALIQEKGVSDEIKKFVWKGTVFVSGFCASIITAKWAGIIKVLEHWLTK